MYSGRILNIAGLRGTCWSIIGGTNDSGMNCVTRGIISGVENLLHHKSSSVPIGLCLAPASTAALTAPIDKPVTADGSKPDRHSYRAFKTPHSYAPKAPPP